VASVLHFTGSMQSRSFTSTEDELHLTKTQEQFAPALYSVTTWRTEIGKIQLLAWQNGQHL